MTNSNSTTDLAALRAAEDAARAELREHSGSKPRRASAAWAKTEATLLRHVRVAEDRRVRAELAAR